MIELRCATSLFTAGIPSDLAETMDKFCSNESQHTVGFEIINVSHSVVFDPETKSMLYSAIIAYKYEN